MSEYFNIEKVFFEKYINELSGDAFKSLLKLMYIAKNTGKDLRIKNDTILRKVIGMNSVMSGSIWNELVQKNLVIKKDRRNKLIYILNSKKIKEDNLEYKKELRNLRIEIDVIEDDVNESIDLIDKQIVSRIKRVLIDVDEPLLESLLKMVHLLIKYEQGREKSFKLIDLNKLLSGLVVYEVPVLKEVCDRYNNDGRIAGMRGLKYVLRMAEGINNDLKNPNKKRKYAREGFRIVGGIEVKSTTAQAPDKMKQKEEGEHKFARKLAMGCAGLIYEKLLKNNEIGKLNRLYAIGTDMLINEGLEDKIYRQYEWIGKQEEIKSIKE